MKELEVEVVAAGEVRRTLTGAHDLRSDIEFQNDVNALLARVEHLQMPWRSLSDLSPAPLGSAIVADTTPLPVATRPRIGRLGSFVVAPASIATRR